LRRLGYGTGARWIDVGVGISSGEEYVGNVGGGGFKDFTAIGDVTNTAARLQAAARGGEIVMCSATFGALGGAYPDAEPDSLQLKGKSSKVDTFRIRIDYTPRVPSAVSGGHLPQISLGPREDRAADSFERELAPFQTIGRRPGCLQRHLADEELATRCGRAEAGGQVHRVSQGREFEEVARLPDDSDVGRSGVNPDPYGE